MGGVILAGPGVMVTPFAAIAAAATALAITPFVGAVGMAESAPALLPIKGKEIV
ncbi:hypothetical protein [Neorhizobium tomejilense]|uniref:hypothetical protein n=1 Tax=Neorhizobium tomejilense TaxID=2093828 RepID=UPI003ECD5CDC